MGSTTEQVILRTSKTQSRNFWCGMTSGSKRALVGRARRARRSRFEAAAASARPPYHTKCALILSHLQSTSLAAKSGAGRRRAVRSRRTEVAVAEKREAVTSGEYPVE